MILTDKSMFNSAFNMLNTLFTLMHFLISLIFRIKYSSKKCDCNGKSRDHNICKVISPFFKGATDVVNRVRALGFYVRNTVN